LRRIEPAGLSADYGYKNLAGATVTPQEVQKFYFCFESERESIYLNDKANKTVRSTRAVNQEGIMHWQVS